MKKKVKRVEGDTFIIGTFPLMLRGVPLVHDSDNDLGKLCQRIPLHIDEEETLSVCRVRFWTVDIGGDETDSSARGVTTIFTVEPLEVEAAEDDFEAEEQKANAEESTS